jgi:hypothetical protein
LNYLINLPTVEGNPQSARATAGTSTKARAAAAATTTTTTTTGAATAKQPVATSATRDNTVQHKRQQHRSGGLIDQQRETK